MGVLAVDMVGLSSCVCGAENWLLIELVLFVKNVAKSLAIKGVVEGTEERVECFEEIVCQMRCLTFCGSMKTWQYGLQQRR